MSVTYEHTQDLTRIAAQSLPISLFQAAEFGLLVLDPVEDRIIHSTPCAARLLGKTFRELSKSRPSDLFQAVLTDLLMVTQACLDGPGTWQCDLELPTANRGYVRLECHAARAEGYPDAFVLLALFDAKRLKRRQAKAELAALYRGEPVSMLQTDSLFRDLERGNRLILNAVGEGIYGVDKHGKTTFVNPAAERMLGWRAGELVGQVAHDVMHHTHECGDVYPVQDCPIYAAFRDGEVHEVRDEVFWRKDGSSFPVEYTSTPIEDDGKLVGAVVVFRDISKRKEQENALRQAMSQVERLRNRLELEKAYLLDELEQHHNRHEIVGSSAAISHITQQIDLVAPTDATVLITGESGTGKELIARAIHNASDRRDHPMIRVNCAAIPAELFESEFFGHVKGSFTGAVTDRTGRFELADGGTLFLDEVGELPLEQQGKLLRVIQEQQFERIGDGKTKHVDVRIIAATNRELRHEIQAKRFREDLYFRLAVFPIHAPPLRDHTEDIPALAYLFLERASSRTKRSMEPCLSVANIETLQRYPWPGNIRELANVIERAVIVSQDGRLRFDLPTDRDGPSPRTESSDANSSMPTPSGQRGHQITRRSELKQIEKTAIIEALRQSKGRVSGSAGAAEILEMKPTTLYARIKRLGVEPRNFKPSAGGS
ncbi:MAG: sigma 54-interacting transcriptional regulator [Pseudomonadota bacterium]